MRRLALVLLLAGYGCTHHSVPAPVAVPPSQTPDKFEELLRSEVDSSYQDAKSPDNWYEAKLLYRENRAMTYGFYHVKIGLTGKPVDDVIEVAAEGLTKLEWKGSRTLVVHYSPSDYGQKILFVKQPKTWRDVQIVYRPDGKSSTN